MSTRSIAIKKFFFLSLFLPIVLLANETQPSSWFLSRVQEYGARWVIRGESLSRALLIGKTDGRTSIALIDINDETVQEVFREDPERGLSFPAALSESLWGLRTHLAYTSNLARFAVAVQDAKNDGLYHLLHTQAEGLRYMRWTLQDVWDLKMSGRYLFTLSRERGGKTVLQIWDSLFRSDQVLRHEFEDGDPRRFHYVSDTSIVLSRRFSKKEGDVDTAFLRVSFKSSGEVEYQEFETTISDEDYREGEGVIWIEDPNGSGEALFGVGSFLGRVTADFELESSGVSVGIRQVLPVENGGALVRAATVVEDQVYSISPGGRTESGVVHTPSIGMLIQLIDIPKSDEFLALVMKEGKFLLYFMPKDLSGRNARQFLWNPDHVSEGWNDRVGQFDDLGVGVSDGFDKTIFVLGRRKEVWQLFRARGNSLYVEPLAEFEGEGIPSGLRRLTFVADVNLRVIDAGSFVLSHRNASGMLLFSENRTGEWIISSIPGFSAVARLGDGAIAVYPECNLLLAASEEAQVSRIHSME